MSSTSPTLSPTTSDDTTEYSKIFETRACICMGEWNHNGKYYGGCAFEGSNDECIASCESAGFSGNVDVNGGGEEIKKFACMYGCRNRRKNRFSYFMIKNFFECF